MRPSFTLSEYIGLLLGYREFLRLWEPRILDMLVPEMPGFAGPRMKLAWVEMDLDSFRSRGYTWPPQSKDQPRLPSLESPAQALGSMYVLEGSSLGGQILSRHFEKTLGVRPDSGCRYLSAYGSDTGVMWKIFCEVLESRPTAEVPQMTLAAVETFQILHECLLSGVSAGCLLPSLPATSKEPGPHASI
jgi:heme oxygenase